MVIRNCPPRRIMKKCKGASEVKVEGRQWKGDIKIIKREGQKDIVTYPCEKISPDCYEE